MPAEWAQEGLELSISTVYAGKYLAFSKLILTMHALLGVVGFEPNEAPSQEYLDAALVKIEERMAYGGRRLAELIKSIYGADQELFL